MHEYGFDPEVVRVGLVLSVVVSVLFYERYQLTTGGAIVPAYLAAFLLQPLFVLTTVLLAIATYLIVNRVLARRWILYGRRKFEVETLTGLSLVALTTAVAMVLTDSRPWLAGLAGVGFLIPGILAHDMYRQRPRKTVTAVLITTGVVALAVYVFASLLSISPGYEPTRTPPFDFHTGYPVALLIPGVMCSILVGLVVFARLGLRSGGFVTAAYLALVAVRPLDLLFTVVIALLTFWTVTRLVMPRLLVFGRRKLSTMILVGSVLAWAAEAAAVWFTGGSWHPWAGFVLMTLMAPALIANDAQRQGIERTLWGASIATLGVYGAMNILDGALTLAGVA